MQTGMLGNNEVLRRIFSGPLCDLAIKLNGEDGEIWEAELKKLLRREPCWVAESLLALVGTVMVPATTGKFVAKDHFVVNTAADAPVKIAWIGDDFKRWFSGKIEEPFAGGMLRYHTLRTSSVDAPIIQELGGEAKAETTLTEFYALLKQQRNGKDGVLLMNGYANVFYIRDARGVLRAVFANWYDVGWDVNTNSVTYPHEWRDGSQFFSRNS